MVGEIRDKETAEIATQASLTGHLVLSTVHTNSAVSAITRLRDMGIEPYLLSSSLVFVLSQRLVRKLCDSCKVPDTDNAMIKQYKLKNIPYKACGCARCDHTGYLGRISIGESISIDKKLGELIHMSASENEISDYVYNKSNNIFKNGLEVIENGKTSFSELLRVSQGE